MIQIYFGITCGRVLNGELYHRGQTAFQPVIIFYGFCVSFFTDWFNFFTDCSYVFMDCSDFCQTQRICQSFFNRNS